ncbi:MAG TPA: YeeE/YedE thiosulfate transporter family protein [Kofleriaceae bacterium]|nr:YeeE/YedE thiosulfate transporter family protein [Kofleriaceae bacterium]
MTSGYWTALGGGALIGLAATILWVSLGRVAGVSGVWGEILAPATRDRGWRVAFVAGMVIAGVVAAMVSPSAVTRSPAPLAVVAIGGLLVGFGTRLGTGCTSGHGVCGLARFSRRSLVAVMTFMLTGGLTVAVVRALGGWS